MTKDGRSYHNTKSNILDIISCLAVSEEKLKAMGFVVDLSVVIRTKASAVKPGSSYFDFASMILQDIQKNAELISACRVDIVADRYYPLSI